MQNSEQDAAADTIAMPMPMDSAEVLEEFASSGSGSGDVQVEDNQAKETSKGWFKRDYTCKWSPTSAALLEAAESRILLYLKTPHKGQYVNIGSVTKKGKCRWSSSKVEERKIWSVVLNEGSENTPLVMVHGLCAALGLWSMNLDSLAESRPVYALDLLGFGRSSRPTFSKDASEAELDHVEAIEDWRREIGLEKFVLLGHSMGGFLSTAYALQYPERVAHLVLADPWGFPKKPDDISETFPRRSATVRAIAAIGQKVNALSVIRAAGPMGPGLIDKVRPDLVHKFEALNENGQNSVANYIYHSNAQKPSGEEAFRTMMDYFGWAKNAMINRIHELRPEVPLTMIYGGNTWLPHVPEDVLKLSRPSGSVVEVHIIPKAGHHVYIDDMSMFNRIVNNACKLADKLKRVL